MLLLPVRANTKRSAFKTVSLFANFTPAGAITLLLRPALGGALKSVGVKSFFTTGFFSIMVAMQSRGESGKTRTTGPPGASGGKIADGLSLVRNSCAVPFGQDGPWLMVELQRAM